MINEALISQANSFLKRNLENTLHLELNGHKSVLLLGSRRAGKTSVLKRLILYLSAVKKEPLSQIFYYDLENVSDLNDLESVSSNPLQILDLSKTKGANTKKKIYIFIDEIQYLNNPSSLLKLTYDHLVNVQIIASGSSTLKIKQKLKDSLVGRKHTYILHPLTFIEFLEFNNRQDLTKTIIKRPEEAFKVPSINADLKKLTEEFILFGGYPEIVLLNSDDEKIRELSEIYSDYVKKDIKDFLKIDNVDKFNQLSKILSVNTGNLINLQDLSRDLGLSKPTIENYLFLLENTYTLSRILPFYQNKRKEIISTKKVFFNDTGLRNFLINNFSFLATRVDSGALFENAVFDELNKYLSVNEDVHFWRTQSGAEVDFIKVKGVDFCPIEVKYQNMTRSEVSSSMKNFISVYHPPVFYVFTKDYFGETKFNSTQINYYPFYFLSYFLRNN